jgi:two-component system alkaline phosphatase synthesis response regulator PhoP
MTSILVIEDTKEIAALIKFRLKSSGYDVVAAENGKLGLEIVQKTKPDLVILDVMMPVMNGLETLMALKSDYSTRSIPVILLTAQSTEQEIIRGLELGADDYITKPFSPQELVTRVKTVLARHKKN